jgi:hypothetical protein
MSLINLTNMNISLTNNKGEAITIPASQTPASPIWSYQDLDPIDGIATFSRVCAGVENLPDPVDGVYLIVRPGVSLAVPNRTDLIVPDPATSIGISRGISIARFLR